jgi:hypothetical protein
MLRATGATLRGSLPHRAAAPQRRTMDRITWLIKFAGAILSVLALFMTGRNNGWI